MLNALKSLLAPLTESQTVTAQLSAHELQLATAALLIEVATIDQHLDQSELDALYHALATRFGLEKTALQTLIEQAKVASSEASSLYEFTQLINQHCDDSEKYQLACELWRVAYADGILDDHEEHIVRRITDLIHLRHSDFIRSKHHIRDS